MNLGQILTEYNHTINYFIDSIVEVALDKSGTEAAEESTLHVEMVVNSVLAFEMAVLDNIEVLLPLEMKIASQYILEKAGKYHFDYLGHEL